MTATLKVVLDTNIIVSAFFGGIPSQILDLFEDDAFLFITSPLILAEFKNVLIRKFGDCEPVSYILFLIEQEAVIVNPVHFFLAVPDDPSDNKFIDAAVEGKADFIVSGDTHLKKLKIFQGIPILTPRQFLDLIA